MHVAAFALTDSRADVPNTVSDRWRTRARSATITSMIDTYTDAKAELTAALRPHELRLDPSALTELRKVDFAQLHAIHDHEEHFLRETFIKGVISANRLRTRKRRENPAVTASDVERAMRRLGRALEQASEATISQAASDIVRDVCPYC